MSRMFFRKSGEAAGDPRIDAARLYLRAPRLEDFRAWERIRTESRDYLTPWEPTWAKDELTREAFRRRLRRYGDDARDGRGHAFFVFAQSADRLLGGVTMSNIRRGVTQTATIGYWMGQPHAGRGLMSEALAALTAHAFDDMGLHRLEAACLESNEASQKVLLKVGFRSEGRARKYLKIDGAWRDHLLYAMLADDPRPMDGRGGNLSIQA